VKIVSRKHIPRGCRQNYIAGMHKNLENLYKSYREKFAQNPFDDETIEIGECLINEISEQRRKDWRDTIEELNLAQNSSKAWRLLKKLNGENKQRLAHTNVSTNEIAHQLIMNGKTKRVEKTSKRLKRTAEENNMFANLLKTSEIKTAIRELKNKKAAGVDELRTEQIKHFGAQTIKWITQLFNNCIRLKKIPKPWRQAHVIALLKPGKNPDEAKSYRPISLLCHMYKLFERVVMNRINTTIDANIIQEQAGFRAGKSCTSQVLNITQHIENGFERKMITGAVFIDLSAAYDTVNHGILRRKIYEMTKDPSLVCIIDMLLKDRRFYVSLNGNKSRWKTQRNGLPQGSVLAPMLFNVYTNDQPICNRTKHFIYADDLALTAQGLKFEIVENALKKTLEELTRYYYTNRLKPNPTKTQVCAFHLRNRDAKRKLMIKWNGVDLEHCDHPKSST